MRCFVVASNILLFLLFGFLQLNEEFFLKRKFSFQFRKNHLKYSRKKKWKFLVSPPTPPSHNPCIIWFIINYRTIKKSLYLLIGNCGWWKNTKKKLDMFAFVVFSCRTVPLPVLYYPPIPPKNFVWKFQWWYGSFDYFERIKTKV